MSSEPAVHFEDDSVTGQVVLDADEVARARGVEQAAGRFGGQVVQRHELHAGVGGLVGIFAVIEARPDVVVALGGGLAPINAWVTRRLCQLGE